MKLIKKTISNIPFDLHDSRIGTKPGVDSLGGRSCCINSNNYYGSRSSGYACWNGC